jgi:hypothetical protein
MAWKIQWQLELDDTYELGRKFVNGLKDSMATRIGWQIVNHPQGRLQLDDNLWIR